MRRPAIILFAGLTLALSVSASVPPETGSSPPLAKGLQQFVDEAIAEGLLTRQGDDSVTERPREGAPGNEASSSQIVQAPTGAPDQARTEGCPSAYPLSFSGLADVAAYADIVRIRTDVLSETEGEKSRLSLALAYIALGLGPEAGMTIGMPDSPEALALVKVAQLVEGRRPPDTAYFEVLERCYSEASLWRAIALLTDGQRAGRALLDDNFAAFRGLPVQLRATLTALIMPALDDPEGRFVAQKLLASFDPKLSEGLAPLRFADAVYKLSQGGTEAETSLRRFLLEGRFEEPALFALMRHNRDIDGSLRAVLLDTLLVRLEGAGKEEDISQSIHFILEELKSASDYLTHLKMAAQPSFQSPRLQDEIRESFVSGLRDDLASEDRLRNLAAIEALVAEAGFLDRHPQRTLLYEQATLKAVRLGLASLADRLAELAPPGPDFPGERAALAYRLRDYPSAYRLARGNPGDLQVGLIAARSAIAAKDAAELQLFTARLRLDDATVLALIEEDAQSGSWIVPERVYAAAAAITGADVRERVARILRLREAALRQNAPIAPASLSSVPDRLMSVNRALDGVAAGSGAD